MARSVDESANCICLCSEHFAKWQHGSIETEDNFIDKILEFKAENEDRDIDKPSINVNICGEDCKITYKEKHFIDLQELIKSHNKEV